MQLLKFVCILNLYLWLRMTLVHINHSTDPIVEEQRANDSVDQQGTSIVLLILVVKGTMQSHIQLRSQWNSHGSLLGDRF